MIRLIDISCAPHGMRCIIIFHVCSSAYIVNWLIESTRMTCRYLCSPSLDCNSWRYDVIPNNWNSKSHRSIRQKNNVHECIHPTIGFWKVETTLLGSVGTMHLNRRPSAAVWVKMVFIIFVHARKLEMTISIILKLWISCLSLKKRLIR